MIIAKLESRRLPTAATTPLVMVVDDDEDIRNNLIEILERLGFEVTGASHGLEALTQLRSGTRPDVILLDLMMPVMDGFEFVVAIRKYPQLATIPLLVITAAGNARVEADKITAAGHIQKPFTADELMSAVRRIVKPSS